MEPVGPAAQLRRIGFRPTPHIGARHIENTAQFKGLVTCFADAGVDSALIVAGDRKKHASPLGIAGVHFFVFGGFNKTVDWTPSGPDKLVQSQGQILHLHVNRNPYFVFQ
ncbi:MAG: hypothetical protein ABI811_12705 [Acidobacteriota bacterium]